MSGSFVAPMDDDIPNAQSAASMASGQIWFFEKLTILANCWGKGNSKMAKNKNQNAQFYYTIGIESRMSTGWEFLRFSLFRLGKT